MPYKQFLCVKKNYSRVKDYINDSKTLQTQLGEWGYSNEVITSAQNTANEVSRDLLLEYKSRPSSRAIVCAFDYQWYT